MIQKHKLLWVLVVALIAAHIVVAQEPETVERLQNLKIGLEEKGITGNFPEGPANINIEGNALQAGSTVVDLSEFAGSEMVITTSEIEVDEQQIIGAGLITRSETGVIVIDNANTIVADGSEDINVGHVDTFQAGPIVITDGTNVRYENGCFTADHVGSLIETENVLTDANQLSYCEQVIHVDDAETVWAGCIRMEDVEDTTIDARTIVTIQSEEGVDFPMTDCASNSIEFESLSDESSLSVTKETISPTYDLHDVIIEATRNNVTEGVETNGTASVEIHRLYGVIEVEMSPPTIYTYDALDPEQDFAVRAWQDDHKVYLKKRMTQEFPADVANCVDCTIVDLANHRTEVRGVIDIHKNQLKSDGKNLNQGPVRFFSTADPDAHAVLVFDEDNAIINDLIIMSNAPPYTTIISNYLQIFEAVQIGNETQRLLNIEYELEEDEVTQSLVKNYKTVYSESQMGSAGNILEYTRSGTRVKVLPPGHGEIDMLLNTVAGRRAMLGLSLLGLLLIPLVPKKKRGQLTIFMIIGLVILAVIGVMLYLTSVVDRANNPVRVNDRQQVTDYIESCLSMSGREALLQFGIQGGHLNLQDPYFKSLPTAYLRDAGANNLLPLNRMELDLAENTKQRVLDCLGFFEGLQGVRVDPQRSPDVKVILGVRDTVFILEYPLFVTRQNERWEFTDFAATVDISSLQSIETANITVNSQIQNEGRINLDTLPQTDMTLFPFENTLLALIEEFSPEALDPYYFFFANKA